VHESAELTVVGISGQATGWHVHTAGHLAQPNMLQTTVNQNTT